MGIVNESKKLKRSGAYVAVRRDTGLFWAVTADHYYANGEEYERGTFYHEFKEAAVVADECNKAGRHPDEPEPVSVDDSGEEVPVIDPSEVITPKKGTTRKTTKSKTEVKTNE